MNFVLVPGAGGQALYWHRVIPELQRAGHTGVPVDLPAADASCGLREYAHTIIDSASSLGEVVLVAQSMAGFSAPMTCDHIPVRQLILVNAMIPRPGETPGDWWSNTRQPEAKRAKDLADGRDPDAPFDVQTVFLHDLPADVVATLMSHPEPVQSDTPFGQPWPLSAWPDVPTRVIVARDDRLFPADFQRRVARERLGLEPYEIPGGHLVALSQPAELARLLDAFVR
jgi:pimeloyl-ACP methyl ester carboxylesterase